MSDLIGRVKGFFAKQYLYLLLPACVGVLLIIFPVHTTIIGEKPLLKSGQYVSSAPPSLSKGIIGFDRDSLRKKEKTYDLAGLGSYLYTALSLLLLLNIRHTGTKSKSGKGTENTETSKAVVEPFRAMGSTAEFANGAGRSRKTLEMILNKSPQRLYWKDKNSVYLGCDEDFANYMGMRNTQDIVGMTDYELASDTNEADMFREFDKNVMSKGRVETMIIEPKADLPKKSQKNGHWLQSFEIPVRDTVGNVLGVLGTFEDVSEILENMLNESVLENALDRISTGLMITAPAMADNPIIYCNRSMKLITGYEIEELIGKSCTFFLSDEESMNAVQNVRLSLAEGKECDAVVRANKKNGNGVWIEYKAGNILDKQGKVSYAMILVTDLTYIKLLEHELLDSTKRQFTYEAVAGLAHDFSNLIKGILGNIALCRMKLEEDEVNTNTLLEAEKACWMAQDISRRFITFMHTSEERKRIFSLQSRISDWIDFVINNSNVTAVYEISEDLLRIEADEGQISQALQNLALNGAQAMPEGGELKINVRNVEIKSDASLPLHPGAYVLITIEDRGLGISEQSLDKIFEPYFTTKQTGTGLGLSIVNSIVKENGGYIEVMSEIGSGTMFSLYLPATAEFEKDEFVVSQKLIKGKGKILVVDDEYEIGALLENILNFLGYQSLFAKDVEEFLEIYEIAIKSPSPFDVSLINLNIECNNAGVDACQRLLEINPGAKTILISGLPTDPAMLNFAQHGFKAVLSKPFNIEHLSQTINLVIAGD